MASRKSTRSLGPAPWRLRLDSNKRLRGPYPDTIDLMANEEAFRGLDFDFEGKMIIGDDDHLKNLRFRNDARCPNILELKNLSALQIFHVDVDVQDKYPFRKSLLATLSSLHQLHWITCQNLPRLRSVKISGGIVYLSIDSAPELIELDVSGCPLLQHLSVGDSPRLNRLNISGCNKLREVIGLSSKPAIRSAADQIARMQHDSRFDGNIYKDMPISQIDAALSVFNEGIKAISRAGVNDDDVNGYEGSILGSLGECAYDREFMPYAIRVLPPNAFPAYIVGTRITNEIREDVHDKARFLMDKRFGEDPYIFGHCTPEECLKKILEFIRDRSRDFDSQSSYRSISARYFKSMAERFPYSAPPDFKIYLDPDIPDDRQRKYIRLVSKAGMTLVSRRPKTRCRHVIPELPPYDKKYSKYPANSTSFIQEDRFLEEMKLLCSLIAPSRPRTKSIHL